MSVKEKAASSTPMVQGRQKLERSRSPRKKSTIKQASTQLELLTGSPLQMGQTGVTPAMQPE